MTTIQVTQSPRRSWQQPEKTDLATSKCLLILSLRFPKTAHDILAGDRSEWICFISLAHLTLETKLYCLIRHVIEFFVFC